MEDENGNEILRIDAVVVAAIVAAHVRFVEAIGNEFDAYDPEHRETLGIMAQQELERLSRSEAANV